MRHKLSNLCLDASISDLDINFQYYLLSFVTVILEWCSVDVRKGTVIIQ